MNDVMEKIFPEKLRSIPYSSNYAYLMDQFARVEMLVVSYTQCMELKNFSEKRKPILKYFDDAISFIKSRLSVDSHPIIAAEYVKKVYYLTELEWFCLIVSIMRKSDVKYEALFSKIIDENCKETFGYDSILKLYYFVQNVSDISNFYEVASSLESKMESLCFIKGTVEIDPRLFEVILSSSHQNLNASGISVCTPDGSKNEPLIIREEIAEKITKFLDKFDSQKAVFCYLYGQEGIGKKTIVKRVLEASGNILVIIDAGNRPKSNDEAFLNYFMTGFREALMFGGSICICNFDELEKDEKVSASYIKSLLNLATRFSRNIFILSEKLVRDKSAIQNLPYIDVEIEDLSREEGIKIWEEALSKEKLKSDVKAYEMANKFTFTPRQIKDTVYLANKRAFWEGKPALDTKTLCDCAHFQVVNNLENKATLIKAKYTWDELVLGKSQKEIIKRACDQIKYKHIVYDKWGLQSKILYGRGLSMLFTGPSGTGKTMAAQVVANDLGLEIYKVDISKVVSKYIGESEKNLGEVFDSAKKSNVILLFDETDALFGKRTEVKDSHDKNANLETSYLLQKMEEYDGITIMTTNFLENIDKAFFRRISYVVHFEFPDKNARKEIWKKMFPKEIPLAKDVDFDYLARQFEIAGGSIKNVVITSSFMAASDNKKVGMQHIVKALQYEIRKQGKMFSQDDFGEYGYLL